MSDEGERSYLPWIMAALVLVIGGAKLEAARPLVARALAVAIPIVPVALGVSRLAGGALVAERAAKVVGVVTLLAAEVCVLSRLLPPSALTAWVPAARLALYASLVGALVAHTLEAQSYGKARFAGYIGVGVGSALFMSSHLDKAPFVDVFGALFVGLLVGGAALLAGELLARLLRKA